MRTSFKLPFRWLVLAVWLLGGGVAHAQSVSRETARSVAETFFNSNVRGGQTVHFADVTAETPFQNFYIFNADSGFVIVAADERVLPILGYSKTNRFVTEDMPENLRWWLEGYEEQIRIVRDNNIAPTQEITSNWTDLKEGRIVLGNRNVVEPLLQTQWGQTDPYNLQCPSIDMNMGNGWRLYCLTGCGATAMAQVMKHWNHPYSGNGSRKIGRFFYPLQHHPEFYPITVNFNDAVYHWENMRNTRTEYYDEEGDDEAEIDAVSTLMFHCGVSIGTNYDYESPGSDAWSPEIPGALINYFFYKPTATFKRRSDYNDDQWVQLLKSELNASRPIIYGGNDPDRGAKHAFVCDGYNEECGNDYFHFNWGYDGRCNGIFPINQPTYLEEDLTFSASQSAIIGIEPDEGSVTVSVSPDNCGVVNGAGVYRKGNFCTLEAIPNNGCVFINWTKNNEVVSTDPTITFKVTDDIHLEANFQRNYSYITTLALPTGSGVTSGEGVYNNGSSCTLTATPNLGYAFAGWYNGAIQVSMSPSYTFTVNGDKTLTAMFAPRDYTITLNASPTAGGTISGGGSYPAGSVVTVSANANSGYRFNGWVENGQLVATATSYMFVANADRDLIATFVSTQSGIGSVVTNADGSQGVLFHIDPSGVGWMVAMDDVTDGCPWGPETNIGALPDYPWNNMVAVGDLSGLMNTGILRITLGTDNDYAASQVDFDHGWYLPSAGQLRKLYAALPFVDSVLYYHGGSTLSEDTYWSSTEYSSSDAHSTMFAMSNSNKGTNHRVRAIRNYFSPQDNMIIAMPDSPTRGTVMNYHNGVYSYGENAAVVATPKAGYVFDHWSEDGLPVSYNRNYTFTFTHSRQLIAHFAIYGSEGTVIHNADGSDGVVFYMNPEGNDGLMVALEDASAGCQWGTNSNIGPLRDYPVNDMFALNDMSGSHNTGVLRSAQGLDSTYAATVVDYANGWYLPAAGELRKLYAALPLIETALVSAGGTTLTEDTYWSSTEYSTSDALTASFSMSNVSKTSLCRVRAIRKFLTSGAHTLVAKANNEALGTVSGSGNYEYNETVTVSAEPNEGYVFQSWTEDGIVVSHDATWQFPFTRNRVLVANFIVAGVVGEIVHNIDGSTGVVFYQNPEGTEGLMVALEDASAGCQWGTNSNIGPLRDYPVNDMFALNDMSGSHNTGVLRSAQGLDSTYAATVVDYANGWYLPAAGELRKLYAALPLIETALVSAGGTTLTEDTYWSSTEYSTSDALTASFSMSNVSKTSLCRVRAIRKFLTSGAHTLVAKANNEALGTVSGSGNYEYNETVTVSAEPNEGYVFQSWTEDGIVVSHDATWQFPFTRNRVLVANFIVAGVVGEIVHNIDGSTGVVFYQNAEGTEGWMVALEDASVGCTWGPESNIQVLHDYSCDGAILTLKDLSGLSNTAMIRKLYGTNNDYAASVVDFANGWYLPSAGQLRKLYAALPMIEESIINAGGTPLTEDAYWSSSEYSSSDACSPMFAMNSANKTSFLRVRAIRNFDCYSINSLKVKANDVAFGTVSGAGNYQYGATVQVTATPNPNYVFDHWEEEGSLVSYNRNYSFVFTHTRTLVAVFVREYSIGSIVHNDDGTDGIVFYTYPSGIGGLVVALEDVSEGCPWGLNEDNTILDNQSPSAVMDLLNDMCGKSNTNRIREWYSGNTEYAACKTDFANGWYLPSAGQLRKLYAVLPMIERAIVDAGGTTMTEDAYWSSTEQSASNAWTPMFAMSSTNKTSNCRVRAIRSLTETKTITANVNIADGGTVTGGGWYDYGQTCTLKAQANESYAFLNWTYGGSVVSTNMEYSFTVWGNQTYTANFVANSSNITTAMDPANSGTVTGAGVYAIGSNCTLMATPHTGYTSSNWTKGNNQVSTQSTYSFTVTESAQYTAHFVINSYAVNATAFPEVGGTVSGAQTYTHGSSATLTATPAEGYTFINWKENGVVVSTSPIYQFVVTGDRTLQANFSNNVYTVTAIVYPSNAGTVEGTGVYEYGTTATLTAHANNGYEFFCWFEDDDMVSFDPSMSFEVTEDHEIYAVFNESQVDYHFMTAGNWSQASNWSSGALPGVNDEVFIDANCTLNRDAEVASLTVTAGKTLTLQAGNTLTVTGTLANTATTGLVIEDGAQLVNASGNVAATMEKSISAHEGASTGWYTIASPMSSMSIAGSGFVTPEYDLYRFNETNLTSEEWENHKAGFTDFTTFEKGRGYLYANNNDFTPTFTGILNASFVTYSLTHTERPNDPLSGFNLIGNPFPHDIYKGTGGAIDNVNLASGYYTLTNEGTWQVHTFEDAIHPGQGVLVKASAPTILTIAKSNEEAFSESGDAKKGMGRLCISVVGHDRAYVYFGQGVGLDKKNDFNIQTPSLWIRENGKDYAIAHTDGVDESLELCFGNKQVGDFALTIEASNTKFKCLQLIDHVTGATVDLLQQPTYSFHATGQEPEARFGLMFKLVVK